MHHDLVDRVQDEGNEENVPDVLPALSHQLSPATLIRQDGPQEGLPALACVPHPGPERQEDCHRRLENEPEAHRAARAADEVFKATSDRVSHDESSE
jgi:hypothetical protein